MRFSVGTPRKAPWARRDDPGEGAVLEPVWVAADRFRATGGDGPVPDRLQADAAFVQGPDLT